LFGFPFGKLTEQFSIGHVFHALLQDNGRQNQKRTLIFKLSRRTLLAQTLQSVSRKRRMRKLALKSLALFIGIPRSWLNP
jgi:hypothetical protein